MTNVLIGLAAGGAAIALAALLAALYHLHRLAKQKKAQLKGPVRFPITDEEERHSAGMKGNWPLGGGGSGL